MDTLKSILKFIVYAVAALCCLAGLWVIYVALTNFREMRYPEWIYVLLLEAAFVCISFTPGFMLLKGLKTKTWHRTVIGITEAIVIALVVYGLLLFVMLP